MTIATGNTGDISEGDTIDYILDEAPAGMDWYEYLELGVVVKANGIQVDIDADWSTYSDLEALSILFVLIWVFPVSEFTSFNGYTVDGNEAFDDYGCTYSMNSGILLEWDITEGPDRMVFEYREGGTYMAPVSPVFIIAGLVAIPIIRRKLN